MGRFSKTFCCCFGASTYEIAPETDDFNIVILKNNNGPTNDLREKLLQTQNVQIEIKPKNPQELQENLSTQQQSNNIQGFFNIQRTEEFQSQQEIRENLNVEPQTQSFKEFFNIQLTQELKRKFSAADIKIITENKQTNNKMQLQNDICKKCTDLQENIFDSDDDDEDLKVKFDLNNEIEQSLAAAISDRATDEVLEALTRYRRGLGIADSPSVMLDEPQTPDIVRSQSSHDTDGMIIRPGRGSILPKLGLESPTATPHMPNKRRSIAQRKVRPQSVVENLSLGHIPDLLESPSSHRSTSQMSRRDSSVNGENGTGDSRMALDDGDECCDSITELPSASFQLQHLVKGRPKRAKTRAPTRPLVGMESGGTKEIGEGLDQFFRPGSVTPTTLTPLVSPTSEECSSLSFVDSPTMSRNGNDQMTSEETTPILEERKPIKLERNSPLLKGAAWATRSRSTDNLEKYSPLVGRKSPLVKMRTESGGAGDGMDCLPNHAERLLKTSSGREDKTRSPSTDSIKSHTESTSVIVKTGNGILRTPIVLQKPRPWSVVGNEPKQSQNTNSADSTKTTPEKLDEEVEVVPFGQSGGSIVGISPGIAIAQGGSGGGSIVGITPGAALEKKSVRELAAGLNRLDLPLKPQVLPRSLLTSSSSSAISKISNNTSNNINNNKNSLMTSSTTIISSSSSPPSSAHETHSKIVTTNCLNNETHESISKTFITENGKTEVLNIRNSKKLTINDFLNNEIRTESSDKTVENSSAVVTAGGLKRIAGKEISTMFEETLVEGLQRSSLRRTFRDTQYTKEDVVDL